MGEVQLEDPFISLPDLGLKEDIAPFSLFTMFWELEIARRNGGIDSASTKSIKRINRKERRHYFRQVPHFITDRQDRNLESLERIVKRYEMIKTPCSMILDDVHDLERHILIAYQVSYAHYVLGKKNSIKDDFPSHCCGISSRSLMLSLLTFGYPNAAYAYNTVHDHGYVMLPFVIKHRIKGVIVIDPTSDQLWNIDKKPRNIVFVMLGDKWSYVTNWANGADLFPDEVLHIGNLKSFLIGGDVELERVEKYSSNGRKYLRKAFSNQIDLNSIKEENISQSLSFRDSIYRLLKIFSI